ncbi:MAG: HNH endonuclease signature motif containing protein [Ilumatobacteraceae bacterium]
MLAPFEQIEFHRDWDAAKLLWGDQVCPDKLARTPVQRRYDAFQAMLDHVSLPTLTDPTLQDNERATEPVGPVVTVLNIVIDAESAVHGLEQLLGISTGARVRSPFGPDRAFCHTFDGEPIALRDAILAGIAGKVRVILKGADGVPVAMSSATRLFTGVVRDAVLFTATHCTHPGCIVPASRCQIDHLHPRHRGGVTAVHNGAVACGHHNRWRHAANVTVVRLADGTIATYRPTGTRITPPPV